MKNTDELENKMKLPKSLGFFELGWEDVELVVNESTGGLFYFIHPETRRPRIEIGLDNHEYEHIFGCLCHEAMEYSYTRANLRYDNSEKSTGDRGSFLFVFNHIQFTEATSRASEFIQSANEPLKKAFEEYKHQLDNTKENGSAELIRDRLI